MHDLVFTNGGGDVVPTVSDGVFGGDGGELAIRSDMESRLSVAKIKGDTLLGATVADQSAARLVWENPEFESEAFVGRVEGSVVWEADGTGKRGDGSWCCGY